MIWIIFMKILMKNKKTRQILIIFDDMVASMIDNKILDPIVTEWFIRNRKQNISLAFVKQSYFPKTDNFRLSSTYYFL